MRHQFALAVLTVAVMFLGAPTSVQAGILIDFDGDGSKVPQTMPGFTQFNAPDGFQVDGNPDHTNAIQDITETYADTGYNVDVRVNTNRHKVRNPISSGDGTAVAMSDLLLDWTGIADPDTGRGPMDFGTLGLTFDTPGVYSITLYHHETNRSAAAEADMVLTDANGARASQHLLSGFGNNPATAPTIETYTVLSDGVNEITLVYAQDPTNNTYAFPLNGLEIVPEPATMTMLALGGLAALRRRRRR